MNHRTPATINGHTELIAHIGYPTHSFKSPMIYNPYFEQVGVNAVVVPMGCRAPDYPALLRSVFTLTNVRGALITMPHKVVTVDLEEHKVEMVVAMTLITVAKASVCQRFRAAL